ncbi:hypothetical protein RchiOBHm_Chr5g0012861 [Rosa chinensis]|uniref:Uncharacterized protein n=1 Tax=Rosa chinensis TaxID=74649 RepID=A0A2P6Q592_ROSCH|nr:surface protein [Rosa chinensis]XP_040362294.1 surface protein [Rosa chinensis]PRQ29341.1 hypothetical protein RchiOBHm_Chr5g0012861 [Rosa chinensis]
MPSGAKRRKAAKKKKEKENQTQNGSSSTTKSNPQGDVSDGGEVGSKPQAKEWRPVTRAKSVEGESSDAEAVRKDGGVGIERDSKEGSKSNKRAGSGKESIKGSSSSSSSGRSSSDDESRVVERRRKEKGGATVSEEKKPASDLVKSVDSLLAEVTHSTNEAPAEKTTSLVAEKAPLAEKTTSLVAEKAPSAEKTASLVAEKAPSLDSDKPVVTVHFTETTPVDGLVISGTVVKPALESGAEKSLETLTDSLPEKIESIVCPPLIENGKASPTVVESVSKENGSKVLPSVGVVESVSKENGSKILPSVGVSPAQTSNDAGSIKDSEIPEYSESQPLVAPAPRVVEKTSCFGCCGILDVITGSRR